jgi:predicted amidophosphoribosyltransferase
MNQILYLLWGANRSWQARKRRKTTVVCSQCENEYPIGTRFCGVCGTSTLVSVPQFQALEDSRFAQRASELSAERTLARAIERIHTVRASTVCATCSRYFSPPLPFCTGCGAEIAHQLLSDENIFPIVQAEFPHLISTFDEYSKLLHSRPARGILRRTVGACVDHFFRVARR